MLRSEILVVEDTLERRDAFRRNLQGLGVFIDFAETALEGIKEVRSRKFDAIFLDCDLSDRDLSGEDVACCFFGSTNRYTSVWVHSWNPEGAASMVGTLKDLGVPVVRREFQDTEDFWQEVKSWLGVIGNEQQQATS